MSAARHRYASQARLLGENARNCDACSGTRLLIDGTFDYDGIELEPGLASYAGEFTIPPKHRIEVLFHRSGLEEYKVDGQVVLSSRAWEYSGFRDFEAGDHSVRIRYSLVRLYCKAYVDGKLVVRDVFPRMKNQRDNLRSKRIKGKSRNPFWVTVVLWMLLTYIFLSVFNWISA